MAHRIIITLTIIMGEYNQQAQLGEGGIAYVNCMR
jgi:hypothetical protein